MRTKNLVILGSTGSIGRQTLEVVDSMKDLRVLALTAGRNAERLAEQCRKYRPKLAVMATEEAANRLGELLGPECPELLWGEKGLISAAELSEADTVLTAVVGMLGLKPTLAAIRKGRRIALANKETLVCGGEIVMAEAKEFGAEIVPVDSEHSAIFQCLMGSGTRREVRRILLTCSGGPFYGMSREQAAVMTKKDALRHPNWKMGDKITVDCATLMNKGLEVIEAMRLYGVRPEQVCPVIHRQSIVHSLVEFRDGAVMAQLGVPDMRIPIQLALTYPERLEGPSTGTLDLLSCGPLTFGEPDRQVFPCLRLAEEAARAGGTACPVLNAANEAAVALFLQEKVSFYDIPELVSRALDRVPYLAHPNLEEILEADRMAREAIC